LGGQNKLGGLFGDFVAVVRACLSKRITAARERCGEAAERWIAGGWTDHCSEFIDEKNT
jgi:hypothetical protein